MRRLLVLGLVLAGCGLINVKGKMKMKSNINGKQTTREVEFHSLEELPAALGEMSDALGDTTSQLTKALVEAPPPGTVKLRHLAPGLRRFEGKKDFDFLMQAKSKAGDPIEFKYVRIGVPTYDAFFKSAMEFYAFTYQARQSIHRLRTLSAQVLSEDVNESAAVGELVGRALKAPKNRSDRAARSRLTEVRDLGIAVAQSTPAMVGKVQELIAAGQGLIAGAAASITNPKTLLHIDLIKQGLEQSIGVVTESGGLLGDIASDLAGLSG